MRKIYLVSILLGVCLMLLAACQSEEKVYHWAILQNDRVKLTAEETEAINARLEELGVDGSIEFHYVTMDDLVTPDTLKDVYKELGGKMDFVSIAPPLAAFSKQEWQDSFIELESELQEGKLKEFYQAVPEAVWSANKMASGIYSFSNAKEICAHGFSFYEQVVNQVGREKLLSLTSANGVTNEDVWQELYEANGEQAICAWTGIDWTGRVTAPEDPLDHMALRKLTNGWHEHDFALLTDDIGFNYETNEFEWLGESQKFEEVKAAVIDLYEKGYIREHDFEIMRQEGADSSVGRMTYQRSNEVKELADGSEVLWVPSYETARITRRNSAEYLYSLVYVKAQKGWETILNALGKDEKIGELLNHYDDMTMLGALAEDNTAAYETAVRDEAGDFIFNPRPVQEIWQDCNGKAAILASRNFKKERTVTLEDGTEKTGMMISIDEIKDFWKVYKSTLQDASIRQLVMEVNRQYKEWQRS